MRSSENYVVVVTHGLHRNVTYATVPSRDSAVKLKADAIKMGYKDAKVMLEADFLRAKASRRSRSADPSSIGGQGGPVHDMRGKARREKRSHSAA